MGFKKTVKTEISEKKRMVRGNEKEIMLAKEALTTSFDLPDELLSVLPSDPYDQLDVARKITSLALSARISSLEAEAFELREQLADKEDLIADLRSRVDSLDASLEESADKLALAEHERVRVPDQFSCFPSTSRSYCQSIA